MQTAARRIAFMVLVTSAVIMAVFVGICAIEIARGGEHAADWGVGLGLGIAGSILAAIAWLIRCLRARRACDAPAEPRRVLPMLGVANAIRSPYLVLVAPGHPLPDEPGFRYERGIAELGRFMWDPAIETLGREDLVLLHRHRRTGVVDLPDGMSRGPRMGLVRRQPQVWLSTSWADAACQLVKCRVRRRSRRVRSRRGRRRPVLRPWCSRSSTPTMVRRGW